MDSHPLAPLAHAWRRSHSRGRLLVALALVTSLGLFATTGAALAVTNTVSYGVTATVSGTPSASSAAPLQYEWTQHIATDPAGSQPDTAPATTIFFASAIHSNAASLPFCSQVQIDGQSAFPSACSGAVVGTGTATAYAGTPGSALSNSVKEDMTIKLVNGSASGDRLLMVVSSDPGAPVQISNRVIPGTVSAASSPYGFAVEFDVPEDLQQQLGLSIVLADVDATISGSSDYLNIGDCASPIPIEAITMFKPAGDYPASIISQGTTPCAQGSFPTRPRNVSPPQISGTPRLGQTLSCAPGTWSGSVATYAFQWRLNGSDIAGATDSTYVVPAGEEGGTVVCSVVATNGVGTATAYSPGVVIQGPATAPANVGAPRIVGTPAVGQRLSCLEGDWSGTTPLSFSFQWRRDGQSIEGAGSPDYSVLNIDAGHALTCAVVASNDAGQATAVSEPAAIPLARASADHCVVPRLKGKTLAAARKALTIAHCRLGKVTHKRAKKGRKGRVIAQRPAPGTIEPAATRVAVVLKR